MKIEVWSDIACPWCYIGKHRLDSALSSFAHADGVEVVWRSYQLDPAAPRISDMNLNQILSEKHGLPPAQAVAMNDQMRRMGAKEGLTYRFDIARYGNSLDAHRIPAFRDDAARERPAVAPQHRNLRRGARGVPPVSDLGPLRAGGQCREAGGRRRRAAPIFR